MGFSSGTSTRWLFVHCFQVELEFGALVFVEGGKPENPEKNPRSKDENQQQTQPTCDVRSGNRTPATAVGGERSHHCAIPTPLYTCVYLTEVWKMLLCLSLSEGLPQKKVNFLWLSFLMSLTLIEVYVLVIASCVNRFTGQSLWVHTSAVMWNWSPVHVLIKS